MLDKVNKSIMVLFYRKRRYCGEQHEANSPGFRGCLQSRMSGVPLMMVVIVNRTRWHSLCLRYAPHDWQITLNTNATGFPRPKQRCAWILLRPWVHNSRCVCTLVRDASSTGCRYLYEISSMCFIRSYCAPIILQFTAPYFQTIYTFCQFTMQKFLSKS